MAVLQKIRVKFGVVISGIIALALLSFLIDPSTLESAVNSMSSKYDVGKIAGKSISYTDYQQDVDRYTTINELLSGSSVQNEQQQKQIRDAAWQELVDKFLFIKNAKAAGIRVGEDEMTDLLTGTNVSPVLMQTMAFADENGNFSPDALVQFVQSIDSDPSGQLRTYWDYLQNTVYTQQFYSKYGSILAHSDMMNTLQLDEAIKAGNTTANIDYVLVNYPMAQDSTIVVSDAEIRNYYKEHKTFFKQKANRDIEYVVFEVVPSEADVNATSEAMNSIYEEFTTTDNMKAFLLKNSEQSLSNYWYKAGELATVNSEVSAFVDENGVGAVSPVYKSGNSFYAVKVMDIAARPETVTIQAVPATDATEVTAELLAELLASEPMDMTQTYYVPGLEGLFDAALNQPQIITTAQYGKLLAQATAKSEPVQMKQVAILEKTALASKETFNDYYSQANNFAAITNGSYKGYQTALDETKVYSHSMKITEATSQYGAIDNAKEVTRWAFDNKVGKASNIITVNNNYFFVVTVKDAQKAGYAPVDKVASSIKDQLYFDKMSEKMLAEVSAKVSGKSLEAIAEDNNTQVQSREGISFLTLGSSSMEPSVIGAAMKADAGKVTVAAGQIGVYVFQVSDKQVGEFYTETDAKNLALQKTQYSSQMLLPVLMDLADVQDNRERFF